MKKQLIFLGIETSCDETAASIIKENSNGGGEILSNIVSSQINEHKEFGGVVPEIAARAHVEKIDFIIKKALEESKINAEKILRRIDDVLLIDSAGNILISDTNDQLNDFTIPSEETFDEALKGVPVIIPGNLENKTSHED